MRNLTAAVERFIAAFVTVTMLTSSIVMAGYVCPKDVAEFSTAKFSAMTKMVISAPMQDIDDEMPSHCAQRQAGEKQALEQTGGAATFALPAIISAYLISPALLPAWKTLTMLSSTATCRTHAPPFLSQRLRI